MNLQWNWRPTDIGVHAWKYRTATQTKTNAAKDCAIQTCPHLEPRWHWCVCVILCVLIWIIISEPNQTNNKTYQSKYLEIIIELHRFYAYFTDEWSGIRKQSAHKSVFNSIMDFFLYIRRKRRYRLSEKPTRTAIIWYQARNPKHTLKFTTACVDSCNARLYQPPTNPCIAWSCNFLIHYWC